MKVTALIIFISSLAVAAQQPSPSTQQPAPRIAVSTTTVVVDVVVRDKSGRPVSDLAREDFELYEDGVRQEITSTQVISADSPAVPASKPVIGTTPPAAAAAPSSAPVIAGGPAVVALVFDRLSPESRSLAQKAGLTYVDEGHAAGDYTGVFVVDLSLHTIQSYTRDTAALRAAVQRATAATSTTFPTAASGGRSAGEAKGITYGSASTAGVAGAESVGISATTPEAAARPAGQAGGAMGVGSIAERELAEMQTRMDETFESLGNDQRGFATTNALVSIVHSLQGMPGRKTVVFFSEGVSITLAVEHHFESVIDAANRANVAIYTLDASGLRVRSTLAETTAKMAQGMANIERNRANGIMMKGLEENEESLNYAPRVGLGRLAQETGGMFFENTNDLRAGMRRIDADRHFYYLLGYSPKNENFDGRFREIAVKVRRPGVEVHARKGYRAIRTAGSMPVLSYEAPALALLDGATVPNAFPVHAGALTFPEPKRLGLTPVLVQVAQSAIMFREEKDKKRYAGDVSVVVRIKDSSDQIVRKLSQRYELGGPIGQLETAKRSEILFYREPELAPGVYTLEAIVYDAIAQKASARLATIEVPRVDPGTLRMSTLIIVRRSERLSADERNTANPLFFGDVVVYPNLGEPLRKGTDKEVGFAATIYPPAGAAAPTAVLELLQNGQRVGQAGVQLPAPDATGRIQYVGRLPTDNLTPGNYELRLTAGEGAARQIRSALFRIE